MCPLVEHFVYREVFEEDDYKNIPVYTAKTFFIIMCMKTCTCTCTVESAPAPRICQEGVGLNRSARAATVWAGLSVFTPTHIPGYPGGAMSTTSLATSIAVCLHITTLVGEVICSALYV